MKPLTLIDKVFALKKSAPFAAVDLDLLFAFAEKLSVHTYEQSEVVFPLHQEAHRFYFIVKGTVSLRNEEDCEIAHLEAPSIFGDESVFSEVPRSYEAVASSPLAVLSCTRTHLLMMISEVPAIGAAFLKDYASRLSCRYGGEQ